MVETSKFSGGDAPRPLRTITVGEGDPLPHRTPSPAFAQAWGTLVLGPKLLSRSTFQPWLHPCQNLISNTLLLLRKLRNHWSTMYTL